MKNNKQKIISFHLMKTAKIKNKLVKQFTKEKNKKIIQKQEEKKIKFKLIQFKIPKKSIKNFKVNN